MKKILFLSFFFCSFTFLYAAPATIYQSEITAIMSGATIEGPISATITLVEYSDMECPFCIRLHNDIQLWKNLYIKYGKNINYVFKNNRGVNHPGTEKKALSALCIKKIGWDSLYIKFYNEVFSSSSLKPFPVGRISTFLRKHKISISKFNVCMRNPNILNQFDLETNEAQKYKLDGTPGVIIINNKTLRYDTILGAYPIENFIETIDSLLK